MAPPVNQPRRGRLKASTLTVMTVAAGAAVGSIASAQTAFPGATGFGGNALGGRGGDVYRVTSLDDTLTPGTLRYGLRESGFPTAGRTIVFDVGGVINLTANLDVKNISRVTIAGQTAPGPGITLAGRTLQVTGSSGKVTSNIILQHIAVRGPSSEDAISIKGSGLTHNVILDHLSTSWSKDELLSTTQGVNNITVQNSFITEALNPSGHSYGSLVRPMINSTLTESSVSYNGNLYTNNKSRNPRPGTYAGKLLHFEFANNVIYNWSDRAGYAGGSSEGDTEHVRMNYLGNHLVAGPVTPANSSSNTAFTRDASNSPIDLKVFQAGNVIDGNKNAVRDGADTGWGMFANWNGSTLSAFPLADRQASAFPYPTTSYLSADDAYATVLASGGSRPWDRSEVDRRYVREVMTNTGAVINALPAEWNQILATPAVSRPAGWDTDFDGMPNWWETARGLNPSVANHNVMTSTGYSNLENYLHHLSRQANWAVDADASWGGILNWAGLRPNALEASATFGGVATAPRTVTLDAPAVTIGQLGFDSPHGYTIAAGIGGGSLFVDVVSGTAEFAVSAGQHTIAAPVMLDDHLSLNVASAGAALAITGPLSSDGKNIGKVGAGDAQVERLRAASLNVVGGTMRLAANAAANDPAESSRLATLAIAAGAQLDLTNNSLVVTSYLPETGAATILGHLQAGRLTSSTSDAQHAIGYGENALLGLSEFAGQTVGPSETLVAFTRLGDANLDGTTNIADFSALASAFNQPGVWTSGDFDYDGTVGIGDFSLLAANFNQSVAAARPAAVPEPATVGLLAAALALAAGRLRRRQETP